MIFGTGIAILTFVYPIEERGKVLGINVAAVYFGLSLGPFLGGYLTQHFGWRSIFLTNVPLGLIIILFISWKLKGEWAGAKGEKFDFTGSIIYSLTLIAIIYGLSLLPEVSGVWLILMGALGIFGFALFSSPNTNAVMSSVEKRFYGVASSTLATMRLTGQMVSMGIVIVVFGIYIGKVQITPEHYLLFLRSAKLAFIIFAALCFLGIFGSLARGKVR